MIWLLMLACGKEAVPTFTQVDSEIFVPSCGFSSCHGSGTGGLTLDGGDDYAALVDVESAGSPGAVLVVPGDADNSYLVWKLEGSDGIVEDPMPPPTGGFDVTKIEQVRAWIDAGALND